MSDFCSLDLNLGEQRNSYYNYIPKMSDIYSFIRLVFYIRIFHLFHFFKTDLLSRAYGGWSVSSLRMVLACPVSSHNDTRRHRISEISLIET